MNNPPYFLSTDQVILIHDRMVADFGGASGIRDRGLLESAVSMPTAYFEGKYLHDDLAAMAGAYLFHICLNQAFVDGNKRTALAAALLFLEVNNVKVTASDSELEMLTLEAARGNRSKPQIIDFFRKHCGKQPSE